MHLSDGHHDQVVRPEQVGGLEEYNFPISCCRAERYVNTVVEWTQDTLAPKFYFPVLWVLAYGDYTSGEIHKACERSYYRNQFKNCLAIGQLHALMYRDLAAHFEQVNVLYLAGNHGRRTPKKDYLGAHDNWDYLCRRGGPAALPRAGQRPFHHSRCVERQRQHQRRRLQRVARRRRSPQPGHPVVRDGSPAKGPDRPGRGGRCPAVPVLLRRAITMPPASLSDVDGELLVNGAWVGTDAFAYNSLSGYREPSQWLHGVNPKHGITWRMNCKLRHENEKNGPKRYLIDGGRDVGPLKS